MIAIFQYQSWYLIYIADDMIKVKKDLDPMDNKNEKLIFKYTTYNVFIT